MSGGIQSLWWRQSLAAWLLLPASLVFAALAALRRSLYRAGVLRSIRLPVPVIVVGNITVGGAGKTPLVLWLAQALLRHRWRPGIVSRGYGGAADSVRSVRPGDDAARVGDEPLLLARRAGCPVWIGRDRAAAGRALLAAHPECNVIIADDGLQHYRLARDFEVAVIDRRGVGNGWLLPAGPLREPPSRLSSVGAVVANGDAGFPSEVALDEGRLFRMRLHGECFVHLHDPATTCPPAGLAGRRLHAVAGIGDPQRFFDHLGALGLQFVAHAFPDHHRYFAEDFAFVAPGECVLMTEKDAVKCAATAPAATWFLPVEADVAPDLAALILEKLNGRSAA